ncbi:hypothetical protein [Legionella sp. PC997]|uniref:hypothetical protein n=1 Tax=Legionella sp. PC997 TaxID=2755562 RepID=UPI0015FC32EB|nr:hypothetical protein [Legionella sp. PC997]QMT60876.1 hypothetical protein HBNCFIEN_02264 [Legionella sp. PC997]
MKKLFLFIFSLTMINVVSHASKIVITGTPIFLEKQGDVYYVPNDYKSTKSYYYVNLNGARQVCYMDKQPELSALNHTTLEVNYIGSTLSWICYPLDTNYFETR